MLEKIKGLLQSLLNFLAGALFWDWFQKRRDLKTMKDEMQEITEKIQIQYVKERDHETRLGKINTDDLSPNDISRMLSSEDPRKDDASTASSFRKG